MTARTAISLGSGYGVISVDDLDLDDRNCCRNAEGKAESGFILLYQHGVFCI